MSQAPLLTSIYYTTTTTTQYISYTTPTTARRVYCNKYEVHPAYICFRPESEIIFYEKVRSAGKINDKLQGDTGLLIL